MEREGERKRGRWMVFGGRMAEEEEVVVVEEEALHPTLYTLFKLEDQRSCDAS